MRFTLLWLVSAFALSNAQVVAQTTSTPSIESPDNLPELCLPDIGLDAKINFRRGKDQFEIEIGHAVGCRGGHDLIVRLKRDDSNNDAVFSEHCPAFQAKIEKLRPVARSSTRRRRKSEVRKAGPFVVHDLSGLFARNSARDTANWLHEALKEVRPCWNNFRDDKTRFVVDRLYAALGINPN